MRLSTTFSRDHRVGPMLPFATFLMSVMTLVCAATGSFPALLAARLVQENPQLRVLDADLTKCRGVILIPVPSERAFVDMLDRFDIKLTPGNVDDRKPVPRLVHKLFGKVFGGPSWIAARALIASIFALPLDAQA